MYLLLPCQATTLKFGFHCLLGNTKLKKLLFLLPPRPYSLRLIVRRTAPVPVSRQARCRPANHHIRENRKHEHGDQRFYRVKPAQNKVLIDRVHHKREDDDSAYSFQSFPKVACPVGWIGQDGPRVKWPAGPRILQSVADGEESRHQRLEN